MKFYAYIPTDDGREPLGTANNHLFELKTVRGAIRHSKRYFGTDNFRLFSYRNFYDDDTFRLLYDEEGHTKPHNIFSNW